VGLQQNTFLFIRASQLLWSYGTRGNDDYFVYHGFALPNNPDEDVVLFEDVQQLLGWALQRLPQLQPLAAAGWGHQQLAAVAGGALAGWFMFLFNQSIN
jgi:hypothetical protein